MEEFGSKVVRTRRLGPWITMRRLRLVRSTGTELLCEQLQDFRLAKHDDGRKGQVPLQKRHVVRMLPRLVQQFDSVSMGDVGTEQAPKEWVKRNKLRIEFHKKGKKYVFHYAVEISQKERRLSGVTMYVTTR